MKRHFFNKLLITYTILVCGLIMLIFSGMLVLLQSNHARRIKNMDNQTLSAYVETFESAISDMRRFAGTLKSIHSLDQFAFSSQGEYYWRMTDLFDDLKLANSLYGNAKYSISVQKQNDEMVISNTGSSKIYPLLENMHMTLSEYNAMVSQLGEGRINQERIILTDENLFYVGLKDLIDQKVIFVLYSTYEALDLEPESLAISFVVDDPRVLDNRTDPPAVVVPTETAEALQPQTVGEFSAGGSRYQCQVSSYYEMFFYYPSSDVIMTAELWAQVVTLVVVSILVCAGACGMVVLFSVRLYRPIDRIVNTLLSMEGPNGSKDSKNELDYLTRRVAQIRQENNSLTALLDGSNRLLREKVANNVLRGAEKPEELPGLLASCGLEWMDQGCVPVLFSFSGLQTEQYRQDDNLLGQLLEMLDEQLGKEYVLQRGTPSASGETVCYALKDAQPAQLKQELHEIILVVDTAFQLPLYGFVGPQCPSAKELYAAYTSLGRLAENYRRLPIKNVYDFNDLDALQNETVVYSLQLESRLVQAVAQNSQEEAALLLKRLLQEYITPAFGDREAKEAMYFALANTLNRAARQAGADLSQEWAGLEEQLRLCQEPEELYRELCGRCAEIIEKAGNAVQDKESALREELESYLRQNLSRDVSLLDLADQFHLSPNYMSALFKSATGSNFKDYLSRLRFERAKAIIEAQPYIKLAQLGEQVGIANVNTLIRVFKKYGGMSPGQYQKMRQEESHASPEEG